MMSSETQTHLRPAFPKPIWMDVFGARLMQLRPTMNAVQAAGYAALNWPEACDIDPDEAAEIFALDELPPGDAGSPGP